MSHNLTPDDLWLGRLQARADAVAPAIPADVNAIVRKGHRRREFRRIGAAAGTIGLATAIVLGVGPAVRLAHDVTRPAQPAPTASTITPTAAQIAARAHALAVMAEQNGIANPPEVAVVRWVTPKEQPFAVADCLIAAGYPITNVTALGYDVALDADQEQAYALADYVCNAQFPAAR
jgi:hypothetical protein